MKKRPIGVAAAAITVALVGSVAFTGSDSSDASVTTAPARSITNIEGHNALTKVERNAGIEQAAVLRYQKAQEHAEFIKAVKYVQALEAWEAEEKARQAAIAAEKERQRREAAAYAAAVAAASKPKVTTSAPAPAPQVAGSSVWDRLAQCESGGNWSINTGNGYYGGLQFNLSTWQSYGGTGYPHQHSRAEQIRVAENLRAARGFQPWPSCSKQLGLR